MLSMRGEGAGKRVKRSFAQGDDQGKDGSFARGDGARSKIGRAHSRMILSGSLPSAGRVGRGGKPSSMYRNQEQRDFARALRSQPTEAEKRLWYFLRAEKLGVKFRRQAAIGAHIVDFVCFSHSLIVELDGPQHVEDTDKERDARRTAWLASRGFRVIWFRNQELDEGIRLVVEEIQRALREDELGDKQPPPQPSPPRGGSRKRVKNENLSAEGREPDRGKR